MQNPHNLVVTRMAEQLVPEIYAFVRTLPVSERWNLASQLIRSSSSIRHNLHEGSSRQGNRALLPFLHYANGSAREVTSQLGQCVELGLGRVRMARSLHRRAERLRFLITKLIKSIERRLESEGF